MWKPSGLLILLFVSLAGVAEGQAASPSKIPAAADYSQEAFVIEQFSSKQQFENDGTSVKQETGHVRIQSEAGAQRYGLLSFSYASGTGSFDIDYVRVRKPDGSIVKTPPESVQDMAAQITREAPFYSDLHEKHIAVKGLSVGDVLEFQIEERTTKPLAPGQFWTEYQFSKREIVLDEVLEIRVPRDRSVKFKSSIVQPTISEAGGYRVYSWRHSNPKRSEAETSKAEQTRQGWLRAQGREELPDVLFTSFKSWDEVGRWYGGLQDERVKPNPEVVAKAAELTKNAQSDEDKIRALYGYVSTQFRYIGVAFGIGRYQPHAANEVLENQYGDCKDKHTLLASLLTAAGIPAYPALISSSHELDMDVPSPGQFNHVITVVPRGSELTWLDTTSEVGPYRYLISPLRGKHALVVWKEKDPQLALTPIEAPFPSVQEFSMQAKLSEAGTLEGNVTVSIRGDLEYLLRASFRAVPLPQWKDLGHQISLGSGFGGDVSDVTASSPEKTDEPFHFAYKYTRKEYGDWANHQILSPLPAVVLAAPGDSDLLPAGTLFLGEPLEMHFHGEIELPKGYTLEAPASVHLKQDFAEYDSTYSFKEGKLVSERRVKTLLREVPVAEREQYIGFMKKVQDDYARFIPMGTGSLSRLTSTSPSGSLDQAMKDMANLPDSPNEEASRLGQEGADEAEKNNMAGAASSLYRAVAADPKFTRAWVMLGIVLMSQNQVDDGIEAFKKAIATDPTRVSIPKMLGFGLMSSRKYEDAIAVWRDFLKAHPDDADGAKALGACFFELMRYPEAIAAFEAAQKAHPDRADLQERLAASYVRDGQKQKAMAAYRKLAEMDSSKNTLNEVAYRMANEDMDLPVALDFATRAVKAEEEESQKITLANLQMSDVRSIFTLSAYWDTLGWVNERMSNFDAAEEYLKASWMLTQAGVVAGHLCHMYKRQHRMALAIESCNKAVHRIPLSQGLSITEAQTELAAAQENLKMMNPGAKAKIDYAPDLVIRERTFRMPRFLAGTESAEFFVLFASDGKSKTFKVEDTKFVSGSDKMKTQGKQLKTVVFNFSSPSSIPARFVRRGILGCYQYSGCSFILLDPDSVHSLN